MWQLFQLVILWNSDLYRSTKDTGRAQPSNWDIIIFWNIVVNILPSDSAKTFIFVGCCACGEHILIWMFARSQTSAMAKVHSLVSFSKWKVLHSSFLRQSAPHYGTVLTSLFIFWSWDQPASWMVVVWYWHSCSFTINEIIVRQGTKDVNNSFCIE